MVRARSSSPFDRTGKAVAYRSFALVLAGAALAVIQPERIRSVHDSLLFPGSDNDGTTWWLLSRCQADLRDVFPARVNNVAYPRGFNLESIPFWNLYDQFRILVLKFAGCDPTLGIAIINTLHLMVFLVTASAVFGFMRRASENQFASVLGTLIFVLINFADNSRVQLSLTVPFFGVMALSCLLEMSNRASQRGLQKFFLFVCLQTLINVYVGVFTVLTAVVLVAVSRDLRTTFSKRLKAVAIGVTLSLTLGVAPLLVGQIRLIVSVDKRSLLRPTQIEENLMEPWMLFSRPRASVFGSQVHESGLGPRLSWISVGILLLIVIGYWRFIGTDSRKSRTWKTFLVAALLLTCFYMRYPFVGVGLEGILGAVAVFRSVSLIQFFFFLLLSGACALTVSDVLDARPLGRKPNISLVLISVAVVGHVVESSWAQRGQTRVAEISTSIKPWEKLSELVVDGPVVHFPDIFDEFSKYRFGLPHRIIEIAQLGHRRPVLNGRDVDEYLTGCGRIPQLLSQESVDMLADGGAVAVVVHKAYMSEPELAVALSTLQSSKRVRFIGNLAKISGLAIDEGSTDPFVRSLNADIFSISDTESNVERESCRFGLGDSTKQIAMSVSGANHSMEFNGGGSYWWHDGTTEEIRISGEILTPPQGRKVVMRFDWNPCGKPVVLNVRYKNGRGVQVSEKVIVEKQAVQLPLDVVTDTWWEKFNVSLTASSVACSVTGDPRNFGVRILEMHLG